MRKLVVYTDGGARGNPGPGAIGVVIYIYNKNKKLIKKYSQYLGENFTNNETEYQAIIFALKKIKALFGKKKIRELEIEIKSDSELLIKQIQGFYKILNPKIQSLFINLWNLRTDFKNIKFELIPREKNKEADKLVNDILENICSPQKLF